MTSTDVCNWDGYYYAQFGIEMWFYFIHSDFQNYLLLSICLLNSIDIVYYFGKTFYLFFFVYFTSSSFSSSSSNRSKHIFIHGWGVSFHDVTQLPLSVSMIVLEDTLVWVYDFSISELCNLSTIQLLTHFMVWHFIHSGSLFTCSFCMLFLL